MKRTVLFYLIHKKIHKKVPLPPKFMYSAEKEEEFLSRLTSF